ncbi:hypothetical protein BD779DRAFT_1666791 [Infundibulicybe gibba]|nr:hypothetical protein BD779DRAFT_1666791 [Infundibulicybe gibba]
MNRNTSGPNTRKRPQQNGQNARRGDNRGNQQDNRGGMAPGASRRGGFAGRGTRGRGPRIVAIRRVRPDEEIGTERSNDITFQTVEEGGEDSEPAEYKLADLGTTNIDEIFASPPTQIASLTSSPPADSNLPAYRTPRWIRETLGGDYSRFADQSPADFVTPHQTLGPLKHVQLTLAHRKDIRINQKLQALKIIQSSVGVGTSDTAART